MNPEVFPQALVNHTDYYCATFEERVYISTWAGNFNPGVISVRTGALVLWNYDGHNGGADHTITTNTTENGSLPSFSLSLPVGGQAFYTFTIPGTYHYYDQYNPSSTGEVIVHPEVATGNAALAVDMNPSTPTVVESQRTVYGSNLTISVVVTNAVNLSHWKICLGSDPSQLQLVGDAFAPQWDTSGGAVPAGGVYIGDGWVVAESFLASGTPGINATGPETLFTVFFKTLTCGSGSITLSGFLADSNENSIAYSRQAGSYNLDLNGCLTESTTVPGQAYQGSTIVLHDVLVNPGRSPDHVVSSKVTAPFGTFNQTTGLPLDLAGSTNTTITMTLMIPSNAPTGYNQLTFETHWQYLDQSSQSWIDGATVTYTGGLTVQPTLNILGQSWVWIGIVTLAAATGIAVITGVVLLKRRDAQSKGEDEDLQSLSAP